MATLNYWKPVFSIYQGDSNSNHHYTDWFATPYSMQSVKFAETNGTVYLDAKLPVKYTYDSTSGDLTSSDVDHKFIINKTNEYVTKNQVPIPIPFTTLIKDKTQFTIESELPIAFKQSNDPIDQYPYGINGIRSLRINFTSDVSHSNYPRYFYPELKIEFINADKTVEKSLTVYIGYGKNCYYLGDAYTTTTPESSLTFAMMVDDSWDDATKLKSIIYQIGKNNLNNEKYPTSHFNMGNGKSTGLYITPFGLVYNGISTFFGYNGFLDIKTATKIRLTWLISNTGAASTGYDHVYDNTGKTASSTVKLDISGNSNFDVVPTTLISGNTNEIISVMYSDDILGYNTVAENLPKDSHTGKQLQYGTFIGELAGEFNYYGHSVASPYIEPALSDTSYTIPTPIALKDEYPYAYKKSKDDVIKEVTKVTDTYPNADRWLRCIAETKHGMTFLKCYGNTDGKLIYPSYVNSAGSLLSGQPGKSSAHLITPLRFAYPKMFTSINGKKCFNDGCFHFRIRFASLPETGNLVLAQFAGVTVGYDIDSYKLYITPSSIDGDTTKNRLYAANAISKSYFTSSCSIDIAIDTYDYAVYFNQHLMVYSDSAFAPAVTKDGEISYSNPVISPKIDGSRFSDGYDVDDIFIDYTTHKPLF